ncbi:hypothetical protein [Jiangella alba]|uniref:DUF3558 domain-containing protein n=1 Tax=Jiangella alba TaxID=561176 RepID=A0A1H5PXI5_9ACTN|nr:hypothetical protein [Jiangella alba]SEF18409.1 hypothetical protein SAMN04488561_6469 [Jiangella alba]
MRPTARLLLGLALVGALTACGGSDDDAPVNDDGGGDADLAALGNDEVPDCPFTAEQVSDLVGTPLREDGSCYFIDGVAIVQATMSSQLAGATTYDYSRGQADERFDRVADLDRGDMGYLGVGDVEGEAVLIQGSGSYTINVSSLGGGADGLEAALTALLDAIPS